MWQKLLIQVGIVVAIRLFFSPRDTTKMEGAIYSADSRAGLIEALMGPVAADMIAGEDLGLETEQLLSRLVKAENKSDIEGVIAEPASREVLASGAFAAISDLFSNEKHSKHLPLIGKAFKYARPQYGSLSRSGVVQEMFEIDEADAVVLCNEYGYDPQEKVYALRCKNCPKK